MANNGYTLDDITNFINYCMKNQDYFLPHPLIRPLIPEKKLYEIEYQRRIKLVELEERLNIMKSATPEEQENFIIQMTPTLDKFYRKDRKAKKR